MNKLITILIVSLLQSCTIKDYFVVPEIFTRQKPAKECIYVSYKYTAKIMCDCGKWNVGDTLRFR